MPLEPFQQKAGPKRKHYVIGALVIVLLIAGAATAIVLLEVHHINTYFPKSTLPHAALKEITPAQAGAAETILVIGSDKRARSTVAADRTSPPRSDTLMLIHMDPGQHQTSVLSIPRDLKVTLTSATGTPMTAKINAAYSVGGSALTAQTVKQTMPGIVINHIVDVDYAGFRKVIDAIGCVYVYVDRHYLNQNTGTVASNYASINIQAGYQRLCGETALDYVRYRHTDTDVVRVARQQDFIRQAKEQVGLKSLFENQDKLLGGLRDAVQTDIHGSDVLHLIDLALFSLARPVRQVSFQQTLGPSYVTATPEQVSSTENDFLYGNPPSTVKVHSVHTANPTTVGGLGLSRHPGERRRARDQGVGRPRLPSRRTTPADRRGPFAGPRPLLHAARRAQHAASGLRDLDLPRPPRPVLRDRGNRLDVPADPLRRRTRRGRSPGASYSLYVDGSHLRVVSWQTSKAVYWVNNTLLDSLTNQQMLAIAQSTRPLA